MIHEGLQGQMDTLVCMLNGHPNLMNELFSLLQFF